MQFDKNDIYRKKLEAPVYLANFILNHKANPEEYLTDFVNHSRLKTDNGNFPFSLRRHNEQSQKQSDVYNQEYELDFKLLADNSYFQALSTLSAQIIEIAPGAIAVCAPRKTESITALEICHLIRNLSDETLQRVHNSSPQNKEEKVIKHIIDLFLTEKNLMFFLPYDIYFQNHVTNIDSASFLSECISNDFSKIVHFRKKHISHFDTFISFISREYFIITKEVNGVLTFYDMVNTNVSKLFVFLKNVRK